jgi:predicted nuclease of predicted toxin-antitoxin system
VKLLFDHNLSPRLIKHLADLYPDSNHVYLLGLDQSPDEEVWEFARRGGFLLVTKDADFSDLCLLLGFPPKVIWIRRGNCATAAIEAILRNHHEDITLLERDEVVGVLTLF